MSGFEALLKGRVLADRYRIEEVIGRGGMGAVYQATDERLGRQVAVKVITLSGAGDPDARERLRQRFLREARAAAALPHHPNVVPVYDFGTDPTIGLDYLVMELLRGEDLATRLARSGAPPLAMSLQVLHDAARGVAVGHRAGLIHRDVKPGNIFLVHDAEGDLQVRVLDFGIAKLADDDTLTSLTQDGRTPHSPTFASPEQLRGLSRITAASDVFSLGAVGYLLLTGERPFTDADRNRMSLGMAAPAPSLRERNPAIPPAIEQMVQRALAYEPEERFADAGVFASVLDQARRELGDAPLPPYPSSAPVPFPVGPPRGLEEDRTEFLDDRTLLAPDEARVPAAPVAGPARQPPPSLPPRRREPERSGMGPFLLVVVLLLLLGAGGVFAWLTLADRGPVLAEQDTIPPPPDEVPPIVPEEEPVIEEQPPLELEAALQNQEGFRRFQQGDFQAAREHFERALQMAPDSATYRYNYGLTLFRLGEPRQAASEFERVLQQDPRRAAAHFYLGESQLALGDTTTAIASMETALRQATEPRERTIAERRLREVRAARDAPPPLPPPGPEIDQPPAAAQEPPARRSDRARRRPHPRPERSRPDNDFLASGSRPRTL
jgi:serine/threonine protein kinase